MAQPGAPTCQGPWAPSYRGIGDPVGWSFSSSSALGLSRSRSRIQMSICLPEMQPLGACLPPPSRGWEAGGRGPAPRCERRVLPQWALERGTHLLLVNEVQVEVRAEKARIRVLLHEPEDALLRQVEAAPGDTLQVVLGVLPGVRVQVDLRREPRTTWSGLPGKDGARSWETGGHASLGPPGPSGLIVRVPRSGGPQARGPKSWHSH